MQQADIFPGTSQSQNWTRAGKSKIVAVIIAGLILCLCLCPVASAKETPTGKKKAKAYQKPSVAQKSQKSKSTHKLAQNKSKSKSNSQKSQKKYTRPQPEVEFPDLYDEDLQEDLATYLGVPYRLGGNSTEGMDCSGFTKRIYSETFDTDLPHKAAQQFTSPKLEKVSSDDLQPGDLVFFSSLKRGITHVGIYLSENKFIHAMRKKGITVSSLDSGYWRDRVVGVKRLRNIGDLPDASEMPSRGIDLSVNNSIGLRFQLTGNSKKQPAHPQDPFRESFDYQHIMGWDPQTNQPRSLDLEYYQFLEDELLNLRLIASRHRYYLSIPQEKYVPHLIWSESILSRETGLASYRQSLKLASDISLFSWLSITPSVTYFDYETTLEDSLAYQRILGLETRLIPQDARASLSVSLQYADQQGLLAQSLRSPGASWEALDLSFSLGYQLSDSLRVSVMGQRAFKDYTLQDSYLTQDSLLYNDLYFKFDISF